MMTDDKGRKVPDYLRMILMCGSELVCRDRLSVAC